MKTLFREKQCREPVVCLHTWGRYPFDVLGVPHLWDHGIGETFTEVYLDFRLRFPCDWLHIREGNAWKCLPPVPPDSVPRQSPASPDEIDAWIERNFDGQTFTVDQVVAAGMYDHIGALADRAGDEVMIFPNQGAPGSGFPWLSWEEQLLLIQQSPDLVQYYVRADDDRFLARVRAAAQLGADGYIFSEGYCGACDLISPRLFEQVFLEPKREFYRSVREAGQLGIGYFLGGIEPYLDAINGMGIDGLLIEEGKKTFTLDPVAIRRKLDPSVVLFGNVDSYLLLTGPPSAIRDEVRRQAEARAFGPFVQANGSPLCPGTPPEHIDAFLAAAYTDGA
ncbi:MAG TPA: uroporphyrinogen decarboxylase family protein [Candidatus Bathyarchaeia archaeon]|nr:uroporphyrinogen decarboxylase family protein [Candidatus Bathyarchaeia archaeon]